jgi:hypothetical protein
MRAAPSSMASCSSGAKRHVQEFGRSLTMFEAFGDHAKCKSWHAGHGLVTVNAVAHDASQPRHFGQPAAVVFALDLDRKTTSVLYYRGRLSTKRMERLPGEDRPVTSVRP